MTGAQDFPCPSDKLPAVGILGGMGPAATSDFYSKLIGATPADRDQDHLSVVIWSDPRVPDRTDALLHGGPDPTPWIEAGARHLRDAGCRIVAMPCNTAHAFVDGLEDRVGIVLVNMISETVEATCVVRPAPRTIGLLATTGAVKSGLYERKFASRGVRVLHPAPEEQAAVMDVIHCVKAGDASVGQRERIEAIIRSLARRGAQTVILGCTELPLLVGERDDIRILDPTRILAEAVVARAWKGHAGVLAERTR